MCATHTHKLCVCVYSRNVVNAIHTHIYMYIEERTHFPNEAKQNKAQIQTDTHDNNICVSINHMSAFLRLMIRREKAITTKRDPHNT